MNEAGELVKKFKDREPHPVEIKFSEAERELYGAVSEYTATGWATLSKKRKLSPIEKNIGKFILTLVQKRMVSSLYALRTTLKRRIDSIIEDRTLSKIEGLESKQVKPLLRDYENGHHNTSVKS